MSGPGTNAKGPDTTPDRPKRLLHDDVSWCPSGALRTSSQVIPKNPSFSSGFTLQQQQKEIQSYRTSGSVRLDPQNLHKGVEHITVPEKVLRLGLPKTRSTKRCAFTDQTRDLVHPGRGRSTSCRTARKVPTGGRSFWGAQWLSMKSSVLHWNILELGILDAV